MRPQRDLQRDVAVRAPHQADGVPVLLGAVGIRGHVAHQLQARRKHTHTGGSGVDVVRRRCRKIRSPQQCIALPRPLTCANVFVAVSKPRVASTNSFERSPAVNMIIVMNTCGAVVMEAENAAGAHTLALRGHAKRCSQWAWIARAANSPSMVTGHPTTAVFNVPVVWCAAKYSARWAASVFVKVPAAGETRKQADKAAGRGVPRD